MGFYTKDGEIYNTHLGIEHDGFVTYNPSHEDMLSWGYEIYTPVIVPPSQSEIISQEIESLKEELYKTDYIALKSIEGYDCDTLYPHWKEDRKKLRDRINELEESL